MIVLLYNNFINFQKLNTLVSELFYMINMHNAK